MAGSEFLVGLSCVIQHLEKPSYLLVDFWLQESSSRLILLELHSRGTVLANAPFRILIIGKKIKCLLRNVLFGGNARKKEVQVSTFSAQRQFCNCQGFLCSSVSLGFA